MKRHWIFIALLASLIAAPVASSARITAPVALQEDTELPWSTVQSILHEVVNQSEYAYSVLESWYQVGRISIKENPEGYLVEILDDDGLLDSILISNL